jgi:hypothetical protein
MPNRIPPTPRGRWTASLIAALAATATSAARADEPTPYYIGASEAITHDSNVYRSATAISDTYSTTSLLGGFDQSIGRQRIYASGTVGYNKYRDQTALDNTSYGVAAGWDWQTIDQLSGSFSASANRSLATQNGNQPLDVNGNPLPSEAGNLLTTSQLSASLRWGGEGPLSLVGSYMHSRVNYSAEQSLASNSSGDSASLGGNYRIGPTVTAGLALRFTRTDTPHGIPNVATPVGPDDYSGYTVNGRNLDLTLSWRATAQTGVDGRLSYTRQSDSRPNTEGYSGLTGALSANYAPTAKTTLGVSYSRDAGTNGSYFNAMPVNAGANAQPALLLSENSQVSDSISVSAGYAATAKISVNAGAQYRRSKNSTDGFAPEYTDNLRTVSLGASYAIARAWQLGCNVSRESRSGSSSFSYDANVYGCSAQFTLR